MPLAYTKHEQHPNQMAWWRDSIENQLAAYVAETQQDWDQHIPMLQLAYHSSVHEATKCMTARLMLGKELQNPMDLICERQEEEQEKCVPIYVRELKGGLVKTREFAR